MNDRRKLVVALGAIVSLPRTVFGQAKKQPVVIGFLSTRSRDVEKQEFAAFKEGLAALGWKVGSQIVIEERWAEGRRDRLEALAAELAAKKPALIVAVPTPAVRAAAKAAPGVPIVQANGSALLESGLVKSLARPGGMVTGVSNLMGEISEKYVELLRDSTPTLRRVGFLTESSGGRWVEIGRSSAARYSMEARFAAPSRPEDIEPALARLAKEGVQGLVVMPNTFLSTAQQNIVKFALTQRWPMIGTDATWSEDGALLAYGPDRAALFRRSAYYVDRILKGAKPGDLPIEQPMVFETVVNLKTAKALGITIPPTIMVQATRVIQ
jgi:putative ABC transport system substrate-binding protein